MAMLLGMGNRNVGYYDPDPRPQRGPGLAAKKEGPSDTPKEEKGSQ